MVDTPTSQNCTHGSRKGILCVVFYAFTLVNGFSTQVGLNGQINQIVRVEPADPRFTTFGEKCLCAVVEKNKPLNCVYHRQNED